MVQNTMDIGRMIYKMVMVLRHGLMVVNMKVVISKGRRMVKVGMCGLMVVVIMAIGFRIRYLVEVSING